MSELHPESAKSAARSALDYAGAFDNKGIDWSNDQPWPHRMELAQALDWITELGAMTLNLADRVTRIADLERQVAELEAIAHSDDGAGGDGMRLFLENVAMKQQVAALTKERDNFHIEYRMACDAESKKLEMALLAANAREATLLEHRDALLIDLADSLHREDALKVELSRHVALLGAELDKSHQLEQQRDELLRVAEGVQARYINRGFFVPEDAVDLMQAIAKVQP